jgi:hypothetical protein
MLMAIIGGLDEVGIVHAKVIMFALPTLSVHVTKTV